MRTLFLITIFIAGSIVLSCSNNNKKDILKVNFPSDIYLEKKSPNGKTNAIIYSWSNSDENFIGSEYRFILGFTNTNSKWYVDYELSEGQGTYEGGITELSWLNEDEVLIKRTIGDRFEDIKYNIRTNKWKLLEEKSKH